MSPPFLSLVLAAEDAGASDVRALIATLRAQTDPRWELLVPQGADGPEQDDRVRVTGVEEAAGEYVAWVGPESRLGPTAVAAFRLACADSEHEVDVLWCHERRTGPAGETIEVRKPLWSPSRLRADWWIGRVTLLRQALVAAAIADGASGEQEVTLRVAGRARHTVRVPKFLHTSPAVSDARGSAPTAPELPSDLSVAVVIPADATRGLAWGLRRRHLIESTRAVLAHAGHPVQVVVVHTADVPAEVLDEARRLGDGAVSIEPSGLTADWAQMVNRGALATAADVLVVLDQACEVVGDGFVPRLVGPLLDAGVGLTGPRLVRTDTRLLDAGQAWYARRAVDAYAGSADDDAGPGGVLAVSRETTGVSRHCLAIARSTFHRVGGMSEAVHGWEGLDLSLKVSRLGLRRIWVNEARVVWTGLQEASAREQGLTELRRRWASPDVDGYLPELGARQAEREAERLASLSS